MRINFALQQTELQVEGTTAPDFEGNVDSIEYSFGTDGVAATTLQRSRHTVTATRDSVANEGVECFSMDIDLGSNCGMEDGENDGLIPFALLCIIDRTGKWAGGGCVEYGRVFLE